MGSACGKASDASTARATFDVEPVSPTIPQRSVAASLVSDDRDPDDHLPGFAAHTPPPPADRPAPIDTPAWDGDDADEDEIPTGRHASPGAEPSEEPLRALWEVEVRFRAKKAELVHGITADPDQFPPPPRPLNRERQDSIADWLVSIESPPAGLQFPPVTERDEYPCTCDGDGSDDLAVTAFAAGLLSSSSPMSGRTVAMSLLAGS